MKWGILATGTIAAKFADTVNQMEGEQLLAACASRTMEKVESFRAKYNILRAYDSYEAMVQDTEVEAVYIATPNNLHFENCVMCLEAGKHVLCEKPFTTTREEGEKLFALAESKGLFIMEAPREINGFEYQIREVERCVKAGMTTSDVLKKEDTLEILELMDLIRTSWALTFACEK